jgi:hypothetical protein
VHVAGEQRGELSPDLITDAVRTRALRHARNE